MSMTKELQKEIEKTTGLEALNEQSKARKILLEQQLNNNTFEKTLRYRMANKRKSKHKTEKADRKIQRKNRK